MEQAQVTPQEAAYWLTLAFQLKGTKPRDRNGLVLTADRRHELGLLDLIRVETADLPEGLSSYASVHEALLQADGRVSAQAFLVQALREEGARIVPVTHPDYPRHLGEALRPQKAPPLLCVAGDLSLLRGPGVAISGSRNAGKAGLDFAAALGRALALRGVTVVTGLARGVDMVATEAALAAGGNVVGVSAAGLLKTPARSRPEVAEGRLTVVSEFAPRARWQGWMAMARNHTIAGLSSALVIADCTSEGGTTAQFGVHRDLGFPVFVRRGPGEGRLMAELSQRPGAFPLHWDGGTAEVPADRVLSGPAPDVRVQHETLGAGDHRLIVEFGPTADREAVLLAVRDALSSERPLTAGEPAGPRYAADVEVRDGESADEPEGYATDVEVRDDESADEPEVDPLLEALLEAGSQGLRTKEIATSLGWSRRKIRERLKSMVEAGRVTRTRDGRSYRYYVANDGDEGGKSEITQLALLH